MFIVIPVANVSGQDSTEAPPVRVLDSDGKSEQDNGQENTSESINRMLAMVGDHVVTMEEYKNRYGDTELTRKRLRPLVNDILLKAVAAERQLSPAPQEIQSVVNKQLEKMKSQGSRQFQRVLRMRNLTESQYKNQLRKKIKKQMLETRVLASYFPQLREPDTEAAQTYARARIMLIDEVSKAWQVYGWLRDNPSKQTWDKLYDRYSNKISLMGESGDLGWFKWGYYGNKIEYKVYSSSLYSVSKPFRFRDSYAIVYPTGYRIAHMKDSNAQSFNTYEKFRRRFYREQLFERLRSEYTVVYPNSVEEKLDLDVRT